MPRTLFRAVGLVSVAIFGLAGCASGSNSAIDFETPVDGTTVKVLVHDSFYLPEELITQLERDTGMQVEFIDVGDAGSMVAGAILASGAPSGDALFGIDNSLAQRAIDADVFTPFTATDIDALRQDLLTQTFDGQLTPIDFGDVCINIDDAWFADKGLTPPTTLADFIEPEYRDLLVVQDPATSSPGLAFLLATIATYGDDWPAYWEALRENGVRISGSWSDAYYGDFSHSGGERPLVVSYATSPPAEIVYAEGTPPERPSTSVMRSGCYRQVEYAGVLRGAQNPAGAARVIDWLLSAPVQEEIPLSMFVFPARADVSLPEVFVAFAGEATDPLSVPSDVVAEQSSQWLTEWSALMGR